MLMPSGMGLAAPQQASLASPFPRIKWADYVRMGDPMSLGIERPERASKMDDVDLAHFVDQFRMASANARKPLEAKWRFHEDMYRLRTTDSRKQEWQANLAIPELQSKVRVAVSMLQGALLDAPEWFRTLNLSSIYFDEYVRAIHQWIDIVQQQARLVENTLAMWEEAFVLGTSFMRISAEDFVEQRPHLVEPTPQEIMQWQQMAMQAMQFGQQPPPPPEPYVSAQGENRVRFVCDWVSAWCMFPDPYASDFYKGKGVVEEFRVEEDELEEMVAAGVYDNIDDIGDPLPETGEYDRLWERELAATKGTRRRHLGQRFTGNIYDREGKIVAKNWRIVSINKRAIVQVGPNQLWSGKTPYICSTPIPYRGRPWGTALGEADAKIQQELTNVLNLMVDDIKYAVLGVFQIDEGKCDEPTIPDSVEPGKIYRGREKFLDKIIFNTNVNQAWPVYQKLEEIGQKETQISAFVDGSPNTRGRPTATQAQIGANTTTAYVHNLARRLEENDLERALQLLFEHVVQFGSDASDPRLGKVLETFGGPQILMDERYRFKLLDVPYKIQVRGLSMMMSRDTMVQRLMQVFQLGGQLGLPPPNAVIAYYAIISSMGFTPEQLGLPTNPEQMQMMLMGMPPQMNPQGGGGAPEPAPGGNMGEMQTQGPPVAA